MKRYIFFVLTALATLSIGVWVTPFSQQKKTDAPQVFPATIDRETVLPSYPAESSYAYYENSDIIPKLEKLVAFKQKKGKQTFYIYENEEAVYALWQSDKSIYLLDVIENERIE